MIPKIVHFFHNHDFFQKHHQPDSTVSLCLATWRHHLPDYELRLWHELLPEFQEMLASSRYLRECYARKIWAAVSDYVRAWVLYHHGGIYLDTDIYLLQSLDSLLDNEAFAFAVPVPGRENPLIWHVEPAMFGSGARHAVLKEVLDIYEGEELLHSPMWIANQVFSLGILRARENLEAARHQALVPADLLTCPDMLVPELDHNTPVRIEDPSITLYPPKMMEQGGQILRIRGRWFVVGAHPQTKSLVGPRDIFSFERTLAYHVCQNSWNKSRYYLETKHLQGWAKRKKMLQIWLSMPWLMNVKRDVKLRFCRLAGQIFF